MEQEIAKILSLLSNQSPKNIKLGLTLNKGQNLIPILNQLGKKVKNLKNAHFAANEKRIVTLNNSEDEIWALKKYYTILSTYNPLFKNQKDFFRFIADYHGISFKILPYETQEFISDQDGHYYYRMDIEADEILDYDDLFEKEDYVYGFDWERLFLFILDNYLPTVEKYFKSSEEKDLDFGSYEGGSDFFYAHTRNLKVFNKVLDLFDEICVDLNRLPSILKMQTNL